MPDWLQYVISGSTVTAAAAMAATYIRTRPKMRTVELQGEAALWAEIRIMRGEAERSKEECDERIERLTARYDAAVVKAEAEARVARHERNNLKQAINFLFASIRRMNNTELSSIAEQAEEMITRGEQMIAIEKGQLPGAKL